MIHNIIHYIILYICLRKAKPNSYIHSGNINSVYVKVCVNAFINIIVLNIKQLTVLLSHNGCVHCRLSIMGEDSVTPTVHIIHQLIEE